MTTLPSRSVPTVRRNGRARKTVLPPVGPWTANALWITVATVVLLLFGLLMSFSASIVDAAQAGDAFGIFRRQLLWAAIGLPLFVITASIDHRVWRRLAWPMLGVAVLALLLVLVPGIGVEVYGSSRWIGIPPFVFQPSELVKLALLLWIADVLERKRPSDGSLQVTEHLLVPAMPAFGLVALLVLLQPDLGTTIVIGIVVAAVLWVEGLHVRVFGLVTSAAIAGFAVLAVVAPYRLSRIRGWLWPERYPLDEGFQLLQSRYALGSGGVLGIGLGASRGKWNFIPNPETDFVFAVIGEELGLLGAAAVLVLFVVLLAFGLQTAYEAPEGFGRTVAFSITVWVVVQALVNVGTVTGLLPITGVTLPLVSAGGTSLIATLVSLGILVSVARDRATGRRARGRRRRTT